MPLSLTDPLALRDLATFLERAEHFGCSETRMMASNGVLATSVCAIFPRGITDGGVTIVGMRTSELATEESADRVVPIRAILERIARDRDGQLSSIEWPPADVTAPWAGVSPPRGGWVQTGEVPVSDMKSTARAVAEEVAASVPANPGEAIVHKVRSTAWSRLDSHGLPAGASFAADAWGFTTGHAAARVFRSGAWTRISTPAGHVLVKGAPAG